MVRGHNDEKNEGLRDEKCEKITHSNEECQFLSQTVGRRRRRFRRITGSVGASSLARIKAVDAESNSLIAMRETALPFNGPGFWGERVMVASQIRDATP